MLRERLLVACALASVGVALAQDKHGADGLGEFIAKGDAGLLPPRAPTAAVDAPYPHIYQAPLFGSLFATDDKDVVVDESALRYYASLQNFDRANAEIKRLKALHPDWTPPTNIYSIAGAGVDEQPFWDLLAADRLEELSAGIAVKEKAEPDWRPSRDLTTKIARKAAIKALVIKTDQRLSAEALAIADADPSILHCAYMDANWRVADAFLDVGLAQRAFEIYHAIIASCPDHDERLATVRKAISRFSFAQTRALIAMGAKSADGAREFDVANLDLTRARVAAANAGKSAETIEPEALAEFFAEVERSRTRADLSLAGWFEYNRGRYEAAQRWFSLAELGSPASADAAAVNLAEGFALSSLKAGRVEAALAAAYAWRDASKTLRDTYVGAGAILLSRASPPPDVAESLVADFSAFAQTERNAIGATALGWYRYNRGEWDDAIVWFNAALADQGANLNLDPPAGEIAPELAGAAEGYARSLARVGRIDEAIEIADRWRKAGAGLEAAFVNLLQSAIDAAPETSAIASDRLAHFAEIARARQSTASAASLGWLAYRSRDFGGAVGWLHDAIAWSPQGRGDVATNQGLALALQQMGRFAEAEDVAWGWVQDSADMRAIYVAVMVAELAEEKTPLSPQRLNRFQNLVVTDRSAAGAQALGWRRLKQDNCTYAASWFRKAQAWSVDGKPDAEVARGLALSLKAVGEFAEAEDIAYAGREHDPEMDAIYFDVAVEELTSETPVIAMSEPRIQRLSERVLAEHNVRGARALGWRRYRQAGEGFGGDWLRLATAWSDPDKRDAKTDEGLGLTLRATGRLAEAEAVARPWADKNPLMKKLYIDVMVEELSRDNPPEPIGEERLKSFMATIAPIKSALGAQALGWYRLERGELDEAARWFKNAVDWWPSQSWDRTKRLSAPLEDYQPILAKLALNPADYRRTPRAYPNSSAAIGKSSESYVDTKEGFVKTLEGYALTLRGLGRLEEAEAIAWAWRDRWPALRALFIDLAMAELGRKDGPEISSQRLRRYLEAIEADQSSKGAAALAWRQYRLAAFDSAGDWFLKAIDWSKTRPPDPALVQGYVMTLQAEKKFAAAEAFAATWRGASAAFEYVYVASELQRLRAEGGGDKLTEAQFAEIEGKMKAAHSAEGALSLAWIAYEAHDYARALDWFKQSLEWGGETAAPKAKEGVAMSLGALQRYEELAAFGYAERAASPAVHDAWFGGMSAWLTADKPLRDVNPEAIATFAKVVDSEKSVIGAQALGWGALLRHETPGARAWFERAIAWSGFDPLAAPGTSDAARAKLIEGYAQALRNSGDLTRAENVAYVWRDANATLGGLYLQIATQALAGDGVRLDDARLARFAALAEAQRSAEAASALGWRAYRGKAFADAIAWFGKAMAWSPDGKADAKINEGYALSLRAAGRLVEAEDFAWLHRDESSDLRAAYVAAVSDQLLDAKLSGKLSPARLARFADIVETDKLSAGASALGWLRLKDGNCGYSLGWFRKAIAWSDKSIGDGKLYGGYAQGLRAVGMFNQAEDAAYTWADRAKEARELYTNIVIEELTRQWPRVAMSEARVERFAQVVWSDHSAPGAQALGWRRYMQAGSGYGGRWFELAAAWSADKRGDAKLNEGFALTQRAVGRLTRAEALAHPWIERTPAMKKLYIDVAVEELSRDFPPEPIPEDRVAEFEATFLSIRSPLGAQALGWYRYARGEYEASARWFKNALDWWPAQRPDSDQKLAVPVEDYQAILAHLALKPEDYRRTPRAYPNSSLLIGHDAESYVDTEVGLAKTIEGYVRALAALSRFDEAEALGFKWAERWPPMRQALIDMAAAEIQSPAGDSLSAEKRARFVKLIEDARSPTGAEALAWKAYKAQDFEGASHWFQSSLEWRGREAPSLDVARAYSDTLRNLKQYDAALKFVAGWRERLPDLGAQGVEIGLASLADLEPASPAAAARLAEIAATVSAGKSASGAAALGWLAYQRKELVASEAWFRKAIQWTPPGGGPDPKALEGFARTLQAETRFADFMRFVDAWSGQAPNLKPLFLEAAAQTFAAAATDGQDIAPEALVRAAKAFADARSVNGAQALAWQRVSAKDWVAAAAWFKAAREWSGADAEDPKTLEGLVLALRNLHHDDEAETLAYQGAQHDESLRAIYLEAVAERLTRKPAAPPDAAGMRRYVDVVLAAKSANGAGALGWYSYNARQLDTAAAWFAKALAFEPTEDAAVGLALAYRRLGDRENYERVIDAYRDTYAKIADLAAGRRMTREQRATLESGEAPLRRLRATLTERVVEHAEAPSAGVAADNALGWKLLNQARPSESARAFEASLHSAKGRERQEAAYGRSLALVASGNAEEAGRTAGSAPLSESQRREVGVQMLAQRAWDAYNANRFPEAIYWLDRRAPFVNETRDLMQMRVWCLQKLGKADAAAALQTRLDQQLLP